MLRMSGRIGACIPAREESDLDSVTIGARQDVSDVAELGGRNNMLSVFLILLNFPCTKIRPFFAGRGIFISAH